MVAACGASLAFDTLSTRRAVANGAVESNGLPAGSNGSVSWGRVIGSKAGVYSASTILQETHLFGQWNSPKRVLKKGTDHSVPAGKRLAPRSAIQWTERSVPFFSTLLRSTRRGR
jgi:hypothetical protein